MMKTYRAIYTPRGKAGEYAPFACNFYVGCSNGCQYCYLKHGVLAHALGGDKPVLKKCFESEEYAIAALEYDILHLRDSGLKDSGLFMSFTTDPCLPDTISLTYLAFRICMMMDIPFIILTKNADWVLGEDYPQLFTRPDVPLYSHLCRPENLDRCTVGFSLTRHDDLEPHASINYNRVAAMSRLASHGVHTWASLEPVVDFNSSLDAISDSISICEHYKVGLMSGHHYDFTARELQLFVETVIDRCRLGNSTVYFKDSITRRLSDRSVLSDPAVVPSDGYRPFKIK